MHLLLLTLNGIRWTNFIHEAYSVRRDRLFNRRGLASRLRKWPMQPASSAKACTQCATYDACRSADCRGEREKQPKIIRGRQARHEQARNGRLHGLVENREAVATIDAIEQVARFQKWNALKVHLVTGGIHHVIDLNLLRHCSAEHAVSFHLAATRQCLSWAEW